MKAHFELKNILQSIDAKGYKSYKTLEDEYKFGEFTLYIDHVQGDPFASPSGMRVRVAQNTAGFPADTYTNRSREIALRDFITRKFHEAINKLSKSRRGSGKSGLISIDAPGQEILERTSAFVNESYVEVRFTVGLPAFGRKVAGKEAEAIFFDELPQIISDSLLFKSLDIDTLYKHIKTSEDADFLRNELENLRLIAFVAEGSILPRESGVSALPLQGDKVIPFLSPENLKMDVELPNKGQITGMGIPRGITFIVGSDSHGKSTLLNAIGQGIYNHIPGDGREYVVSNPNSVKIGSEKGRNITRVNISAFTNEIKYSSSFSTDNSSSEISQTANIVEAVEVGADVLLIDREVTKLFIQKAKSLFYEYMVSSILVKEDLAKYYDVADFVIEVNNYQAEDITVEAKEVAEKIKREIETDTYIGSIGERIPLAESIDLGRDNPGVIDLNSIEQLVTASQTKAIGDAINYAKKYMDGEKSFRQVTSLVMLDIGRSGLDVLNPRLTSDYAEFRKLELAAAINRLRSLKVEKKG